MTFAKRVFLIAGIYGVLVLTPMYFMEAKTGRDFPPAITHPEYYYGFIGLALVCQILFLIIATDPVRYRPVMIPAILEKISFVIPVLILFFQGRVAYIMVVVAMPDLLFFVLFILAYFRTRSP
jgi:hypothetical protein